MPGPSFAVEVAGAVAVVKTPQEIDVTITPSILKAYLGRYRPYRLPLFISVALSRRDIGETA